MSDPVAELARLVEEVSGNVVPEPYYPFLAQAAERRVHATGTRTLAAYVEALARGSLLGEWGSLLPLVTVNESYFFRTPQHFTALIDTLLPRLLPARAASRRLRVWSAGCARGEEPATLAIAFAECKALAGWSWRILATDVDEEALGAARRGRYGGRALAHVSPELLARYFVQRGEAYALAGELLAHIDYQTLNLMHEPFPDLGEPFDVVLLRNVLIYFRLESQRRVAATIAATLAEDGYLFLGPAETLWQISDALEPVDLGDCFCYRRKTPHPPTPLFVDRGSWFEKGLSTTREAGAAHPGAAAVRREPPSNHEPRTTNHVPEGTKHVPSGTRERLEEAVAVLLEDRISDAIELVQQALSADPAHPETHALEGFIHDLTGRSELAIASFRASLYLDHALFQVRLLLANALRRLGWEDRARHEYRAVLGSIASGGARQLAALAALPLPDRATAAKRARAALSPQPTHPGDRR